MRVYVPGDRRPRREGGSDRDHQSAVLRVVSGHPQSATMQGADRPGPRNGDQVIAQAGAATATGLRTEVERGQVPGGHGYSRTIHRDGEGRIVLEQWLVPGGDHAWCGRSAGGAL